MIRPLLFLLLFTAQAWAQITIDSPDGPVPIGQPVWMEINGIDASVFNTSNSSLDVFPRGYSPTVRLFKELTGDSATPVLYYKSAAAPPGGKVWFLLSVAMGDKLVQAETVITHPTGPSPKPDPEPTPEPDPPPILEGARYLLLIYDESNPDPETATLRLRLRQDDSYIRQKKHPMLIVDPDAKNESGEALQVVKDTYLPKMTAPPPFLFIVDTTPSLPRIIYAGADFPRDYDKFVEFIKKYGG